jgi:hypothetical protein
MMRRVFVSACAFGVGSIILAGSGCGGSSAAPAVASDASVDAPDDAALAPDAPDAPNLEQDPNKYPSNHQPIPVLTNPAMGPVLASPKIVTITFTGDPRRDSLRAFDDALLGTAWWTSAIGGIGVGAGAGGGHVEMDRPWGNASTVYDSDIQALIQNGIQNGTLPRPDSGTIYALYFDSSVTVAMGTPTQSGGLSCDSFCGYHAATLVNVPNAADAGVSDAGTAAPSDVAYAVLPACAAPGCWAATDYDGVTVSASHEFAEAASDPYASLSLPSFLLDTDDSWLNPELYSRGSVIENGDACAGLMTQVSGYAVQRIWSNASAMRSEDPCQPSEAGRIFFGAAPRTKLLPVATAFGQHNSYGYLLAHVGTTATTTVDIFSNAPLPHDLTLSLGAESSRNPTGPLLVVPQHIEASLDRKTGHNGNGATLTVSVPAGAKIGKYRIVIRALLETTDFHDWPLIIDVRQ